MVQMTVQSSRRSLLEFSESPIMSRCNSLSSSHLLTGAPQSITEWLSLWEKDPVEILLDLGFGTEEPDVCTKIPPRFLSGTSVAKGINIRVFLEAQKQRMDIERPNLYERFRQLEVLGHITSALSSLLTDVNTQQTKEQDTVGDETGHLDAANNRPVVTRAKWRRTGQLLKRASQQLKQDSLVPGEANLPDKKEQPHSCADIAEKGRIQTAFSAHVTFSCLTQEEIPRGRAALAYPTPLFPQTPSGKTQASSHPVAKQPCLAPVCEVTAKDRPRKETPLLVAPTLKTLADLDCKLPDSFEMEEIQSFEDETPCGNAPDATSAEVMVTRTSSCQSDSSGFMEELPEPAILQNASFSEKINFIFHIHNQETALSHMAFSPLLNQDCQQKASDLTVPRQTKARSDQGEETHRPLTADNGKCRACNAEPQTFEQEMFCDMDKRETKTARKQLEKKECIKEHIPCFQVDGQDEGDPRPSKFDHCLYFNTEHKKVNVAFVELSDINPAVISENKIGGEDGGESCLTVKDAGIAHHESSHQGHTRCVEGPWWGVEVASKDGTLLTANEVTNGQEFCKMDGDTKNTKCFPQMGLPETPKLGSAVQSGSRPASSCSLQVSQRHPSCPAEGPGVSSEHQETSSAGQVLGANQSEQGDSVQKVHFTMDFSPKVHGEMASVPLKSVTVQMSSGLEFTSRVKYTGQTVPVSEGLAREDVEFSDMLVHHSEDSPLMKSDPQASEDGVKQTAEASSQTDIHARKPRWPPLLHPPHRHLTKSASLDTMPYGKYRSHCWDETSGAGGAQASCCCHCCCHGCSLWTSPMDASPHRPACCCSNHASAELHLLKTLMVLQDTAVRRLSPCTLHEIEAMKSSCQHFQEKLDEIEQHLTEQQALFSSKMTDEGREEGRHLQLLRQAVRQEVEELEFRLNDQACQVKEDILMQLDQLLVEQSHLFSELGLSDWKGERKAQNKQVFPDAADTVHPRNGCSEMVPQRAPSKTTTATGSHSALQLGVPPTQFPTRTILDPNSAVSDPQDLSTHKKETKGPSQAKMDFKSFLHSLKKSFQNSLGNDSAEGKE
ncbi:protein ITPRID1 [Porphyrio hochstetteri]